MTPREVDHMAGQLLAQLVIITLIGLVAWRTRTVTFSGAIALMLFAYGAWALGGPEWVVGPPWPCSRSSPCASSSPARCPRPTGRYQVVATFYVSIVAAILFIANNTLETLVPGVSPALRWGDPLYTPFVGVVAAQLGLLLIAQLRPWPPRPGRAWRVALSSVAMSFVLVAPVGLAVGPDGITAFGAGLTAGMTVVAAGIYLAVGGTGRWPSEPPWNVRLQALSTALVAVPGVAAQLWWLGVT
jgi:hypothetical protein